MNWGSGTGLHHPGTVVHALVTPTCGDATLGPLLELLRKLCPLPPFSRALPPSPSPDCHASFQSHNLCPAGKDEGEPHTLGQREKLISSSFSLALKGSV